MGRRNTNTVKNKKICQIWDKFNRFFSKHNRFARFFFTVSLALLCAVLLSVVGCLWPLASRVIDFINQDWYMNTFFTHYNMVDEEPSYPNDIAIVNVADSFSSRKNIAAVIESVAAQKPRLIFVDGFFAENDSYDESQKETLQKTIADIKDSVDLVFVEYWNDKNELERSFFAKSLELQFGTSNFGGFGEFVPYYGGEPRISLKIAAILGVDTAKLPPHFITNYRTKEYNPLFVSDSLGLDTLSGINHNDIVLIGQLSSPYDVHTAPFFVKKNEYCISGIETIAYELSSILAYDKKAKSKYGEYPYIPSKICTIIIYVLFFLLSYAIYVLFDYKIKRKKIIGFPFKKSSSLYKIFSSLFPLVSPFLLLFVEILIVLACFFATTHFFAVPNISLLIASFVFVEPSYNCSKKLTKSIFNCNEKN